MRRLGWSALVGLLLAFGMVGPVLAASTSVTTSYLKAKVLQVSSASPENPQTMLTIQLENGAQAGSMATVPLTGLYSASDITNPTYSVGNIVVVSSTNLSNGQVQYAVIDHWRLPDAAYLLIGVVILAVMFAGWRGVGSLLGLVVSLLVVGGFVLPRLLHGGNASETALAGCFAIAAVGIYLAHGFSRRTTIALVSVYMALILAALISEMAVRLANLNGIATEDASYLHQQLPFLNIQGVLLAGIMIGVLGVLDDITVGQAAAVDELRRANRKLKWQELYSRGIRIGREHIASLINTLVLAYAGSSLVFIAYVAGALNLPVWLSLNSELVMEEVVRSLVGSVALILAVPIATGLSAFFLTHSARPPFELLKRPDEAHQRV